MENKSMSSQKLKVGMIGLGGRGRGLMTNILALDEVAITALCDLYEDRIEEAAKRVTDKGDELPFKTKSYKEVISSRPDVIIVSADWEVHVEISTACMEAGIPVGMEVGGAYDIQGCWELVDCYEKTKTPFMFLENCCYHKDELIATSLVRNGLLGKVVHCQGGYCHDLRHEIVNGTKNRHYRLRNYLNRNCENYPTHELGPICKILNINRGNRLTTLVSMASKAIGLSEYIKENPEYHEELGDKVFAQGDIVTTMIKCENGETIVIKLDTTLPRLYERGLTVSGTKGFYCQTTEAVILDNGEFNHEVAPYKDAFFTQKNYEKYLPDDWKNISKEQIEAGHGGMDYIMLKNFFKAVKNKEEMPLDVYDGAVWMSVTALSSQSIANNSMPVEVPDFTRGKYKTREEKDVLPLI